MDSGSLVDTWGEGNFIALKFTPDAEDTEAATYRVGLDPSAGSGLVELDADMDGVFKVTDKDAQRFVVETANADHSRVSEQYYDLSGLVCETE